MLKLQRFIYAASVALALLGAASGVLASEAKTDPTTLQMVENSHSPADHAALAKRYEQQAADYERQAAEHVNLAAKYRKMPTNPEWALNSDDLWNTNSTALTAHCENQAKRMTEAAAEAREIAQLHADIAKLITAAADKDQAAARSDADVAAEYRTEAAELHTKAESHRKLSKIYAARTTYKSTGNYKNVAKHCDRLAAKYEAAAKEAEAVASDLSQ